MGSDYVGLTALICVTCFLALTAMYQYRPWSEVMSRYDLLHLIPRWTFFAPNPAMRDAHIVMRFRLADGFETDWVYLDIAPKRTALDPLWNPGKRARKVVSDCINSIKSLRFRLKDDSLIKYYIPYLILLNVAVNATKRPSDSKEIQFSIIETTGRSNRRIWVYFTSEPHALS